MSYTTCGKFTPLIKSQNPIVNSNKVPNPYRAISIVSGYSGNNKPINERIIIDK